MSHKYVLYSPGYGAGWSSWAYPDAVARYAASYKPLIDFILAGGKPSTLDENSPIVAQFLADLKRDTGCDTFYLGGLRQLTVYKLPHDALYRITEYDGSESVETMAGTEWWS